MRPVAVYSALRVGMFLACLLVLRVAGVSGLLSVVVAVLVSLLLSFLVLRRQRDAVTRALMERSRARGSGPRRRRRSFSDRLAEDAAVEDAAVADARPADVHGTDVHEARRAPGQDGARR